MRGRRTHAWVVALAVASCAAPRAAIPTIRFANAPPVQVVDDRRDVPVAPKLEGVLFELYHYDGSFHRRITRALELPPARRALGINALDEVPDSTWFTNRIGVRDLTLDEVRAGPTRTGSPEPHKPWTILNTKVGGESIGFVVKDARGEKFLLKFDRVGYPVIETATAVIVNRLLWAAGYNVPEDYIVDLCADDLVLAPDATIKEQDGTKRPLRAADLANRLTGVLVSEQGRMRGMASRILDGTWLDGHPGEGVRADDPNDRIAHERRRDLRGAQPVFAWVDHTDAKLQNTLDMWQPDRANPAHHYVVHYLIDFGKSLGAFAKMGHDPRPGYTYHFDLLDAIGSLVTAGIRERTWEHRSDPGLPEVGMFDTASFDPTTWRPHSPAYVPFLVADRIDKFWGAKIVMRFTRDQIRAAVETGQFGDPRSAAYLVDTLVGRQRKLARHWFEQVNPLDRFAVVARGTAHELCFDDLTLTYELRPVAEVTRYVVTTYDRAARRIGRSAPVAAATRGHTCTGPLVLARDGDGYTIVELETRRPLRTLRMFVHLARDPATAAPRVIGIWRE